MYQNRPKYNGFDLYAASAQNWSDFEMIYKHDRKIILIVCSLKHWTQNAEKFCNHELVLLVCNTFERNSLCGERYEWCYIVITIRKKHCFYIVSSSSD